MAEKSVSKKSIDEHKKRQRQLPVKVEARRASYAVLGIRPKEIALAEAVRTLCARRHPSVNPYQLRSYLGWELADVYKQLRAAIDHKLVENIAPAEKGKRKWTRVVPGLRLTVAFGMAEVDARKLAQEKKAHSDRVMRREFLMRIPLYASQRVEVCGRTIVVMGRDCADWEVPATIFDIGSEWVDFIPEQEGCEEITKKELKKRKREWLDQKYPYREYTW